MLCLIQSPMMKKELSTEPDWSRLYTFLREYIPRIVYAFHFALWRGQEEDVIEDVIQETMRRVTERVQRVQRGDAEPIRSLEHISVVIAANYCRDIIRRDHRLIHMNEYESLPISKRATSETQDGLDIATEMVYQHELFSLLADEINRFPCKQRTALLIDLAHRMSFGKRPTPLQEAFLAIGIHLEEYKQCSFGDVEERKRNAALLAHAYKRITKLDSIQWYADDKDAPCTPYAVQKVS